jgi:hypothetical protein
MRATPSRLSARDLGEERKTWLRFVASGGLAQGHAGIARQAWLVPSRMLVMSYGYSAVSRSRGHTPAWFRFLTGARLASASSASVGLPWLAVVDVRPADAQAHR